jgi:hypothetical protein
MKRSLCSQIDRINMVKIAILPKEIYIFNTVPIKITMTFIQRLKNLPKVHLETQKTRNSQSNTGLKEQCWRYHNTWVQTILHSHSNKNSIVLAQRQICRPVEQNRGLGYESTKLPYFWKGAKNMWWWKDSLFKKCC